MEKEAYQQLVNDWNQLFVYLSLAFAALFILVLLFHIFRAKALSSPKAKYDYLKIYENKVLRVSSVLLALIGFSVLNTTFNEDVSAGIVGLILRGFVAFCIAVLVIYVSHLLLKYVHPGILEKRLKKLRYQPRVSPAGNTMRLLTEEEEDIHLDAGMQAEEAIFSVDYDVWVDEQSGHVKIEKYPGYFQVLECGNCGFNTLKLVKEELIEAPTNQSEGKIKKYYACTYCTRKREKIKKVAKLGEPDGDYNMQDLPPHLKAVLNKKDSHQPHSLVKIQINPPDGISTSYEFENYQEARNFLAEYEDKHKHEPS